MDAQDSPRPGRASPIIISQPASARGFIPLTARSAASGQIAEHVGDANVDPFVNSEPNRSAITDPSAAVDGQPSDLSTLAWRRNRSATTHVFAPCFPRRAKTIPLREETSRARITPIRHSPRPAHSPTHWRRWLAPSPPSRLASRPSPATRMPANPISTVRFPLRD